MSDQALRAGLIRLAYANPSLRPALLPLIEREAAGPWTPERRLVTALNAVAEAITHVSLLARESRPAQQDADRALKLLEGAEQVLGRDVARNLSLPGYRAAAASYKAGDKVWVPSALLPLREQEAYLGTVEVVYADGSLSVRVQQRGSVGDYPVQAAQVRMLRPHKNEPVKVTYNAQLDALMDGWAKDVRRVLDGDVLKKEQRTIGNTLVGMLHVSSGLLPSKSKSKATFHLDFRTGQEWSVTPAVHSGDTLNKPARVKWEAFAVQGAPASLRRGANAALSKFLAGMTGRPA